jgi:hypothetical protein
MFIWEHVWITITFIAFKVLWQGLALLMSLFHFNVLIFLLSLRSGDWGRFFIEIYDGIYQKLLNFLFFLRFGWRVKHGFLIVFDKGVHIVLHIALNNFNLIRSHIRIGVIRFVSF